MRSVDDGGYTLAIASAEEWIRATFCEENEWVETMGGDFKMSGVNVAGDSVVEVAGQFCGDLARAGGDVLSGFGQAAVRVVVVIDGLIEGLIIVRACRKLIVPVAFIVIGALEEVGGIFGGGHIGDCFDCLRPRRY